MTEEEYTKFVRLLQDSEDALEDARTKLRLVTFFIVIFFIAGGAYLLSQCPLFKTTEVPSRTELCPIGYERVVPKEIPQGVN